MKLTDSFNRALWVFHVNTGSCNGCDIPIVAASTNPSISCTDRVAVIRKNKKDILTKEDLHNLCVEKTKLCNMELQRKISSESISVPLEKPKGFSRDVRKTPKRFPSHAEFTRGLMK